jgi:hypothetical protein
MTVPSAIVTVCTFPGAGNPCTNTVPIYSDPALTQPISNPLTTDQQGRFGFWIASGIYVYSVQKASGIAVGTFPLSLNSPPGPQGPGGAGCGAAQCIISAPSTPQTITQPANMNLNVITSGTGLISHNGVPVIDGSGGNFLGDIALNFHKITNSSSYFNYLFSSNNVQQPTAVTGRTWANPEYYLAVNDNSAYSTNPFPQGDLTITPLVHIESFNNSPNDAAPMYLNHVCTNGTSGNPPNNIGCVGLMVAAQNTASSLGFPEAINAIMQINSTNPLVQAQGIELNAFNNTGSDSILQANTTFNRGPYFGFSSTAGGNNLMVAGFHTTQQGHGSGWQYGAWVENASDANFMAGFPGGGGGSQDAFQASPVSTATSTANSASMPIDLRTSQWSGSAPSPFATLIKAIPLTSGVNPITCMNVSFTNPGSIANICNDGSVQIRGTSWRTFNGSPSGACNSGDFATNASALVLADVFWVCFPANTWNRH